MDIVPFHSRIIIYDLLHYREYDAQEHTAQEVKDEVELHLKEREILENALPTNVVIGPFWVNTDQVKQKLCKKRKELSLAVLELLAKKLRKQADDVIIHLSCYSLCLIFTPHLGALYFSFCVLWIYSCLKCYDGLMFLVVTEETYF